MKKALVVYGTKTGCTAGIAEAVAEALREKGVAVDVARAEAKPDPSGYHAVIVGSGIRAGMWHGVAKQWLVSNAGTLRTVPLALFSACLTMHTDPEKAAEVRAYTDPLVAETGITPVDIGVFAGMNVPKTFSLPERLIMKAMKAPEGDFRDTGAAHAWARAIAEPLGLA